MLHHQHTRRSTFAFALLGAALAMLPACSSADRTPVSPTIENFGGAWDLVSIGDTPLPASITSSDRRPSLLFARDGSVTGSGGVNRLSSRFDVEAVKAGKFSMRPAAMTRMAGSPEAMEIESRFTQALDKVNACSVTESSLTLSGGGAETLKFNRGR